MNILFFKVLFCLLSICTCHTALKAREVDSTAISTKWPSQNNWEVDVGFRKDKLKWNIGGFLLERIPGVGDGIFGAPLSLNFVNVLSELIWKDLRIAQVGASGNYVSERNYAIKLAGTYGHIYHGENTDSDYAGDDRTELFSLSENGAGRGYVYDFEGGVGYRLTSSGGRCTITPLVGYALHTQSLHIFDGYQAVCINILEDTLCATGDFQGLNSTYEANWYGPWVGMDFNLKVEECAYLFGGFEWQFMTYRGRGSWNLRPNLEPFHHKASGLGYTIMLGTNWEIWRNLSIGLISHYRHFKTHHGTESNTINDDGDIVHVSQPLNQVRWISYDLSAMLSWRF